MIPSKELIQKLIDEGLKEHAKNNQFDLRVDGYVSKGLYQAQYEIDLEQMSSSDFHPLRFTSMQEVKDYSYAIDYYQRIFRKKPYVFFAVDVAERKLYVILQRVYNHETEEGLNAKNFPSNLYVDPRDVIDQLIAAYPKPRVDLEAEYDFLVEERDHYPKFEGQIIKGKHTFDLSPYKSTKLWI
jgi:hypothetical protein